MDELEIKKLWQTTNDKLEKSFVIDKKNTEEIARVKIYSILGSMKPIKVFALFVGILWVGIGGIALSSIYLNSFNDANKFFLFSASIQVGLTAISLYIYLYQLITIYQIDITEPIIRTQEKLSNLKISTLWVTRLLFLQLPVWTTFWWNETMLTDWGILQWIMTLFFTLSFISLFKRFLRAFSRFIIISVITSCNLTLSIIGLSSMSYVIIASSIANSTML